MRKNFEREQNRRETERKSGRKEHVDRKLAEKEYLTKERFPRQKENQENE